MQNHSTPSQITPFSSKARAELGELHTDMSNSAADGKKVVVFYSLFATPL